MRKRIAGQDALTYADLEARVDVLLAEIDGKDEQIRSCMTALARTRPTAEVACELRERPAYIAMTHVEQRAVEDAIHYLSRREDAMPSSIPPAERQTQAMRRVKRSPMLLQLCGTNTMQTYKMPG